MACVTRCRNAADNGPASGNVPDSSCNWLEKFSWMDESWPRNPANVKDAGTLTPKNDVPSSAPSSSVPPAVRSR